MFETSTSTYAGDFSNSNEFNSVAAPYNPYARAQQQQPQQLYTQQQQQQQQQHDDDGLSFVDLFDTRGRATDLLSSYVVEEVGQDGPLLLENGWAFWYDKYIGPGRTVEEYAAALHNLGGFGSVQDFWNYYNNLPSPMQLRPGNSMHLMKLGVVPLWEDAANVGGGSFSVRVPKHQTAKAWLYVLLAAIGEQFHPAMAASGDDVCGVSVSVRRGEDNVLTLWNRDARVFDLSSFFDRITQLVPNAGLSHPSYKPHFAESDLKVNVSTAPLVSSPPASAAKFSH